MKSETMPSLPAGASPVGQNVQQLREAFDRLFAAAPVARSHDLVRVLVIRLGSIQYAFRSEEITSIEPRRAIVPLPSTLPHLLGLAGVRGRLIPVFSLAGLLGVSGVDDTEPCIALCGKGESAGLAFPTIETYLQVQGAQIFAAPNGDGSRSHLRELVKTGDASYPIVSVASLLSVIRSTAGLPAAAPTPPRAKD